LGQQNQFVDQYFGLPLRKDHIFVVGTMKGNARSLQAMNPDLWNRLKNYAVQTSPLNTAGRLHVATTCLTRRFGTTKLAGKVKIDILSMAKEICRNVPENEPGRFIDDAATKVVKTAVNLSHTDLLPECLDASLVTRVLYWSWSDAVYYDARPATGVLEKFRNRLISCTATVDIGDYQNVLFLHAYVDRAASGPTQWSLVLDNRWVLHAELPPTGKRGLKLWACSSDGLEVPLLAVIRPSYLATMPLRHNEFIGVDWPNDYRDAIRGHRGVAMMMAPLVTQELAAAWAPQKSDTHHFVAIPLTLAATNEAQKEIQRLVSGLCRSGGVSRGVHG
jgi:hypothetical protein